MDELVTRISKTKDREVTVGLVISERAVVIEERWRWVPTGYTRGKWERMSVSITREELAAIVEAVGKDKVCQSQ